MPRRLLTKEQREQSRTSRLERERERQRRRRLDPEFRAIERARNTIAKRISRAKGLYENNGGKLFSEATNGSSKKASLLVEKGIIGLEERNRLKKEKEKERQRKRRMDPEFRAKERARNTLLKRISRQKNYISREYNLWSYNVVNCECCGEPIESDHVCFSNILSVDFYEADVSNSNLEKVTNDSSDS